MREYGYPNKTPNCVSTYIELQAKSELVERKLWILTKLIAKYRIVMNGKKLFRKRK